MVVGIGVRPAWAADHEFYLASGLTPTSLIGTGAAVVTNPNPPNGISGTLPASGSAPAARWISRNSNASSTFPASRSYDYVLNFSMPACFRNPVMTVEVLADNRADYVRLNSTVIGLGGSNPSSPITVTHSTAASFNSGFNANTLTFHVVDTSPSKTGLDYRVRIQYDDCPPGLLKICKVADMGVPLGTVFTFNVGGTNYSVPAGPSPSGTCIQVGTFPGGSTVHIEELARFGTAVSGIIVFPLNRQIAQNTANRTVDVRIGNGDVTEVTYRNRGPIGPGVIEICKAGQGTAGVSFTYRVQGMTVTVAGGTCSPAITITSGLNVRIDELAPSPWRLVGCATFPVQALVNCDRFGSPPGATVTVLAGTINDQTAVTFTNAILI